MSFLYTNVIFYLIIFLLTDIHTLSNCSMVKNTSDIDYIYVEILCRNF